MSSPDRTVLEMFRGRIPAVVIVAAVLLVGLAASGLAMAEERPIMRFPDIHGDRIVFCYGEDIWTAPTAGGVATRLTIHDGEENFPKFSPDGSLIAFTGEYDGNADVYVMNGNYLAEIRRTTHDRFNYLTVDHE